MVFPPNLEVLHMRLLGTWFVRAQNLKESLDTAPKLSKLAIWSVEGLELENDSGIDWIPASVKMLRVSGLHDPNLRGELQSIELLYLCMECGQVCVPNCKTIVLGNACKLEKTSSGTPHRSVPLGVEKTLQSINQLVELTIKYYAPRIHQLVPFLQDWKFKLVLGDWSVSNRNKYGEFLKQLKGRITHLCIERLNCSLQSLADFMDVELPDVKLTVKMETHIGSLKLRQDLFQRLSRVEYLGVASAYELAKPAQLEC